MPESLAVAGDQIVGGRARQEDALRITELAHGWLVVVADGMGGHAAGDAASRLAIDAFVARCRTGDDDGEDAHASLQGALAAANGAIADTVRARPSLAGMGTTLTAALVRGNGVDWISVGDSLLWVLRDGALERLNADHSMKSELAEEVARGALSAEEAAHDPARHTLRSAVMGEPLELIDHGSARLAAGELVVLATDGIDTLTEVELARLLAQAAPCTCVELVARCLREIERRRALQQDNTTIVIARSPLG